MPDTRAALTIASEGGNTRFSTNTDTMADVGALMALSPGSDGIGIGRYCRPWDLQATDWHEAYRIGHLQPGGLLFPLLCGAGASDRGRFWQHHRAQEPGLQHWLQERLRGDLAQRNHHHAGGAGADRRGDDLEPADHGDRGGL